MINLMPDETKRQIRAGHTNLTLLNYMVVLICATAFLAVIIVGVYLVLTGTKTSAQAHIDDSQSRTTAYKTVEAQATALRSGLATAKTVLDQEVDYSKIITGIAAALPDGVVLGALNLSPSTIGTPIVLQAYAKTTDDALALKQKFQSSPYLGNVTIQSLTTSGGSADYPVSISVGVTIKASTS